MSGLLRCTGLLAARGKSATPGYGYEYAPGQFGIDVYCPELEIDTAKMAVKIPFADGNRRDGVGDLLEVAGIETSRHRVNPIVLYDHGKAITLPVAMAQHPDGNYSVEIDPNNRRASAWAYFYQGKGASYVPRDDEYDHAYFCEQLFDLMVKKFVRGGSIGYTVISARELPPDSRTGIPKGLHLLAVKMLELSAVVLPANQDTVGKHLSPTVYTRAVSDTARRILSMPKVCGKPLSPHLVKSLSPYVRGTEVRVGFTHPQRQSKSMPMAGVDHKRIKTIRDRWRKLRETKAEATEAPASSSRAELTAAARQGDAAAKRRLYGQMRKEGRARLRAASPGTQIVSGSSRRSAAAEEAKKRRQAGNTAATGGSSSAAGDSGSANANAKVRRARTEAPAEYGSDQGAAEGMHGDAPPKAKKPKKAPAQDSGRGIPKPETPRHVIGRAVEPGGSDESNKSLRRCVKCLCGFSYDTKARQPKHPKGSLRGKPCPPGVTTKTGCVPKGKNPKKARQSAKQSQSASVYSDRDKKPKQSEGARMNQQLSERQKRTLVGAEDGTPVHVSVDERADLESMAEMGLFSREGPRTYRITDSGKEVARASWGESRQFIERNNSKQSVPSNELKVNGRKVRVRIQADNSGAGHDWYDMDPEESMYDTIMDEITAEIIEGDLEEGDEYVASNGVTYRWFDDGDPDDEDEEDNEASAAVREMADLLNSYGDQFSGDDAEETAQEWLNHDFTARTATPWMAVDIWDASTASHFQNAGMSPDQVLDASAVYAEEHDGYSSVSDVVYALCNGDISPHKIVSIAMR